MTQSQRRLPANTAAQSAINDQYPIGRSALVGLNLLKVV